MKTDFFISHPVMTIVLSLVLVLGGGISILVLPIAKYPPVLPPTVEVKALYPGASAEVIEETVTTWLEDAINGVPGMVYMTSRSNDDGSSTITVTFELGYDVDSGELDILNRVTQVTPRLPAEVRRMGVSVRKVSQNLVLSIMLYDEENRYSTNFLSNYAQIYMIDEMARVPGVGAVGFRGQRIYAMRIWLDPDQLATRQLTASDVVAAIEDQNLTLPLGATGLPPTGAGVRWQRSVNATGRLQSAEAFSQIVVKPGPANSVVRLSDVADIELGSNSYSTQSRFEGHKSVAIIFKPVPGANLVQMAKDLRATVDRLRKDFPPGLKIVYPFDETIFINAAIKEVVITLITAILLVGLVIFAFLRDWRSTLIPMITIPVSLLGTFALMKVFGFSINLLTLFGLTLATGLVVDDAIVVVENISRLVKEKGISVIDATGEAMQEVLGAVVASTLALVAVFVPCAFFPGVTGQLYEQFALTIACSLVLSLFTALTLAPAIAGRLLKSDRRPPRGLGALMERALEATTAGYGRLLGWIIPWRALAIIVFLGLLGATAYLYLLTPTSFLPDEDQGYFVINLRAPTGTALAVTQEAVDKVTEKIESLPGVLDVMSLTGFSMIAGGGSNYATIFANLKPWKEREAPEASALALIERLNKELMMQNKDTGWSMMSMDPPSIQGLSAFGGFQLQIKIKAGGPLEELARVTREITNAANKHPKLRRVFSDFSADNPELFADIDREQALARGIPLAHIFETLQIFLSSIYVNDFNAFGRIYQVFIQARQDARADPLDIPKLYVRAASGEMVTLRSLVKLVPTRGSASIPHYNLDRSSLVQGRPAPGVGSNEALTIMTEIAEQVLPSNMTYEWTGVSLQAIEAGNLTPIIFMLGLVFVYLVLAAQYGSFVQPLIIMLVVPLAILGALLALWYRDLSSDIYAQVGFVMLVGLSTKNAILIVEVANQVRARGGALIPSTIEAAKLRLRPILMTTFAFAIGIFPMVIATGAGAASRQSLGTTVFGGIVVSTVLSLVLTPVLYVSIEGLRPGSSDQPGSKTAM